MPDINPDQLTLFQTSIDYSVRLTSSTDSIAQSQDWPLPFAASLDEAIDALRGFGLFLMFNKGILWGSEWDIDDSFVFNGVDQNGSPVWLGVTMQDSYVDREGNKL